MVAIIPFTPRSLSPAERRAAIIARMRENAASFRRAAATSREIGADSDRRHLWFMVASSEDDAARELDHFADELAAF